MKEKKLKIIIVLMTLAVLGLVVVQVYWLVNLIKVESEKFDHTVMNSMARVANKLEKEEAAKTVLKKITLKETKEPGIKKRITVSSGNFNFFVKDSLAGTHFVHMINDDEDLKWEYKVDTSSRKNTTHVRVFRMPGAPPPDRLHAPGIFIQEKIDTIVRSKKKLVQNVVTEMMEYKSHLPIEKRIKNESLNKLLTDEFANRGIDGDFFFAVRKLEKDSLTLVKSGSDVKELKKSDYRTLLFPEEIFASPNELVVYFPNKNRYILGSLIGMLSLSIIFIFTIVGVFYKTVQMFIRQKKITEVKNDLINNITHEFKTPIATISLACEALNEPLLSSERQSVSRYSKIIKEENDRLQLMVDTLLNTAAMERDELKIRNDKVNLTLIISSAINKFEEVLKQKEGSILFEKENEDYFITGDKFHLMNVFCNLIDNAVKYNTDKPEIKISMSSTSDQATISITDNGIGIPAESLDKIFETFYRVQSGNIQNFRGNGIGLSYSKKIIELHKGTISVSSKTGIGSTFIITLPLE